MFRRTALVAALTIVTSFLAAPPAARAAGAVPSCLTGGFTDFGLEDGLVRATAAVLPCPSSRLPAEFALIGFTETEGTIRPSRIYPLTSKTVPTSLAVTVSRPGTIAVCIGHLKTTPVDCLRIEGEVNRMPLVYRIPIDDPVVRKPIVLLDINDPQPGCGNCV